MTTLKQFIISYSQYYKQCKWFSTGHLTLFLLEIFIVPLNSMVDHIHLSRNVSRSRPL